jgi:hypothetical protein
MTTADGMVIGTTAIVDHGSATRRFNLVLVAEGYRQAELAQFAVHAQQFVNRLFATPPFDELQCALNVYRVDVASTDSGADDPTACGGSGAAQATYFDASFCNNGIQRLLVADPVTVQAVVNAQVPAWHQILVIVNSSVFGGSGGLVAVTSVAGSWEDVAIHEMGHSAFGLADEYEYYAGCGIDSTQDNYSGGEPAAANVTSTSDRATIKWADLVMAATGMPTTANADCGQCDPQPAPVPTGTVGAYEGAFYFHCGAYRPEFQCMMRDLTPFCAVCRRRIRQTLSPYLGECYAPVFSGSNPLVCVFRTVVYVVAVAALVILAWIPSVRCLIKSLLFQIRNCGRGNANRCIEL